jgi:hypothetical protein
MVYLPVCVCIYILNYTGILMYFGILFNLSTLGRKKVRLSGSHFLRGRSERQLCGQSHVGLVGGIWFEGLINQLYINKMLQLWSN